MWLCSRSSVSIEPFSLASEFVPQFITFVFDSSFLSPCLRVPKRVLGMMSTAEFTISSSYSRVSPVFRPPRLSRIRSLTCSCCAVIKEELAFDSLDKPAVLIVMLCSATWAFISFFSSSSICGSCCLRTSYKSSFKMSFIVYPLIRTLSNTRSRSAYCSSPISFTNSLNILSVLMRCKRSIHNISSVGHR